jgi:hypothetical protein
MRTLNQHTGLYDTRALEAWSTSCVFAPIRGL